MNLHISRDKFQTTSCSAIFFASIFIDYYRMMIMPNLQLNSSCPLYHLELNSYCIFCANFSVVDLCHNFRFNDCKRWQKKNCEICCGLDSIAQKYVRVDIYKTTNYVGS